jgi:hypothetical protein
MDHIITRSNDLTEGAYRFGWCSFEKNTPRSFEDRALLTRAPYSTRFNYFNEEETT